MTFRDLDGAVTHPSTSAVTSGDTKAPHEVKKPAAQENGRSAQTNAENTVSRLEERRRSGIELSLRLEKPQHSASLRK